MSTAADSSATAPQRPPSDCHDRDQALAVTVAILLLTGTVLLVSCWVGPLTAYAAVAVVVVTAYAAPGLVRRIAVRRAVRRLLRDLPGA
ncbi:hypothetical protein [Streptomyces humi]